MDGSKEAAATTEGPVDSAAKAVTEKVRRVTVSDPELVAMHKVFEILDGLEPGQALRVLEWNRAKVLGPDVMRLRARIEACQEEIAKTPALGLQGAGEAKYRSGQLAHASAQVPEFG